MKLLDLADLDRGPGRMLLEATVDLGFSEAVAREGLTAELEAWCAPGALEAVLTELPEDLPPERRPASVLIIAARTLPASLMRAALMARLLGARVRIKPASERHDARASKAHVAVAEALAAADPDVTVTPFSSRDEEARQRALSEASSVVVLGSDETVSAVEKAVPEGRAFVGYGHRLSVAWLDRPDAASLDGLARDLCAWDQAGCLSPQVAWVSGESPAAVAPRLAEAVRRLEVERPMTVPQSAAHARASARTYAEMMGTATLTETAVIATLPGSEFRATPGYRFLWLLPAEDGVLDALGPHLSTVGVGGEGGALALPDGVRVCALGQMQRPSLRWLHDGRPNLLGMLRP